MDYHQFLFEIVSEEKKNVLIALLSNIGFDGFEEENESLKAFIKPEDFDENEFNNIINQFDIIYSKSVIKEKNWNEEWESGFAPVLVLHPVSGLPFTAVRANFHAPVDEVLLDLVITPKMSFGTGHHATTYLMIEQMSLLNFKDKLVIDFGTGTGVLAILAEKLGAADIIAIDNDDWSINNAQENIFANNCNSITLVKAETITAGLKADIILANINLNIIISNLNEIKAACNAGATILFSGIMPGDEFKLIPELKAKHFTIIDIFKKDNWMAILTKALN